MLRIINAVTLYGTELGSVTLKRVGLFCFPIKHSTHTLLNVRNEGRSLGLRSTWPCDVASNSRLRDVASSSRCVFALIPMGTETMSWWWMRQKRLICEAKETYFWGKRDLFVIHKRPVHKAKKTTCAYAGKKDYRRRRVRRGSRRPWSCNRSVGHAVKRVLQKRPTIEAKETYYRGTRRPWSCNRSVGHFNRSLLTACTLGRLGPL